MSSFSRSLTTGYFLRWRETFDDDDALRTNHHAEYQNHIPMYTEPNHEETTSVDLFLLQVCFLSMIASELAHHIETNHLKTWDSSKAGLVSTPIVIVSCSKIDFILPSS